MKNKTSKTMKRKTLKKSFLSILAALICLTSVASLSTTAFAAEVNTANETVVSVVNPENGKVTTLNSTTEKDELRDYIQNGIVYDLSKLKRTTTDTYDYTKDTYKYDEASGTLTVANAEKKSLDKDIKDFAVCDRIAEKTFPGALIKANQKLANGNPDQIVVSRTPMEYSASFGGTFTAMPTSTGSIKAGINKLIKEHGTMDENLKTVFTSTKASSEAQLEATLGINSNLIKTFNIDFNAKNKTKSSTYVVKFTQAYYTITAVPKEDVADYFTDNVTKAAFAKLANSENPPAYVSSVTYGKEIYMVVKTNSSDTSISAAEKIGNGVVDVNSSQKWKNVIENCSVNMYVLGGSSEEVGKLVKISNYQDFVNALSANTKFDASACAYPLSYTATFLGTNEDVVTKTVGDYVDVTYRTYKSTPIKIKLNHMSKNTFFCRYIYGSSVKIEGKTIVGIDTNGKVQYGANYSKTYTYGQEKNRTDTFEIPANVDLSTVVITPDYRGKLDRYFSVRSIRLADAMSNNGFSLTNLKSLEIELEGTGQFIAGYRVDVKLSATMNSNSTYKIFETDDHGNRK